MKGKWIYIESELLGQTLAFDTNSYWLFCKDGTRYSPAEVDLFTNGKAIPAGTEIPLAVHTVKKLFDGKIVAAGKTARVYEKIK